MATERLGEKLKCVRMKADVSILYIYLYTIALLLLSNYCIVVCVCVLHESTSCARHRRGESHRKRPLNRC